ncbi:uncharacterized protein F4822DRAFT_432794 [Hypoxylon trugodes]|uniref:uncharacterized protein n=1 Tax=Hypoxylon trugodes TaxID=326681 RepID=UPI00218FA40F|nr:uncharacterized protein F4822DRAFT_432794 [Hypoxylon trugodes]KAI1385936.1 hypothetical protein F4822DRAFT_432794 [Hypoxylon trugodes]
MVLALGHCLTIWRLTATAIFGFWPPTNGNTSPLDYQRAETVTPFPSLRSDGWDASTRYAPPMSPAGSQSYYHKARLGSNHLKSRRMVKKGTPEARGLRFVAGMYYGGTEVLPREFALDGQISSAFRSPLPTLF